MIVVLTGTNNFLLRKQLREQVNAFVDEHGDLALERLDGETVDFNRVHEALSSVPFLSSKKMVILSDASSNKAFTEHIDELLAKKQKSYQEYAEPDDYSLVKWLNEEAKARGGDLSTTDARSIVDRVGSNQQLLSNELEKLILYRKKIDSDVISLLIEPSPRSTVFDMLEAAFNGRTKRALELYGEQRQLRKDPQAMIALIAWQIHILALIKVAGQRSPGEIAKEGRVNPFVVNKSISIAKRLSTQQIKDLVHETLLLDIALKSQPIDADSALKNLLLKISKIEITA
ncbi:MAG: hypothetical protein NTX80_01230 [Candidatus Saccharibacteria bacterium]|nr:hypothetical protein [Candidatus Saccharibacteria bacterium]